MRRLSQEELERYIESNAWQGLAGGYGIQQEAKDFITKIEGCFSNVIGLPLGEIGKVLFDFGIPISMKQVKEICTQKYNSSCCIRKSLSFSSQFGNLTQ